jgi:transposase InsO family protein
MSVSKIVARGRDPLRWSAAAARDRVRESLRSALSGRRMDRALSADLGRALQDTYVRRRTKKARNWPHKKKEKPPGNPKIRSANAEQRRAVQRLKVKPTAA